MDSSGDNSPYLKYFNDRTQFLLRNSDEVLEVHDPTMQVEPIFTEIDNATGWSVEGLSVLLNGPLIAEEPIETAMELVDDGIHLHEALENSEIQRDTELKNASVDNELIAHPIVNEVPGKGFITAEGLFLPNELLLHLNFQNDALNIEDINDNNNAELASERVSSISNHVATSKNNEMVTLNYEVNSENSLLKSSTNLSGVREQDVVNTRNELIQLFSTDGTLLNGIVSSPELEKNLGNLEDLFETVTAHKCKQCSYLTEYLSDMVQHLESQHKKPVETVIDTQTDSGLSAKSVPMKSILNGNNNQTVYLCSQCNMGYSTKMNLKKHMIAKHNLVTHSSKKSCESEPQISEVPPTSTVAESKPKQQADFLTNLVRKQQKVSKKVKCCVQGCDIRFANEELRLRHEECHEEGQKKQFKCPKCHEKFSIWRVCSSHLWKCHNIDLGLLSCPICLKFKAISFGRMKAHIAVHNDDYPFMCHECGKGFKQYSQLKNHQLIHLDSKVDKMPDWACQKQCEMCEKYFANSKTLKKHIQFVHNKYKPFICNICGHKTSRKAMLDLHIRQHTGEKPHQCPVCVYKTGDPNCLRKHMMRHEGNIQYTCPHCDYQSIQSTAYKNHIATKHPGQGGSYYCSTCSYHTVSETSYYAHKREHELQQNEKEKSVSSGKSSNGLAQSSVLMQINEISSNSSTELQDDETRNCFLNLDQTDDAVDTGGITIPAGYEIQTSL